MAYPFVRGWVGPCGQPLSLSWASWLVLEILRAIFRVGLDPKNRGWGDAVGCKRFGLALGHPGKGGPHHPCRWNMTGWLDLDVLLVPRTTLERGAEVEPIEGRTVDARCILPACRMHMLGATGSRTSVQPFDCPCERGYSLSTCAVQAMQNKTDEAVYSPCKCDRRLGEAHQHDAYLGASIRWSISGPVHSSLPRRSRH